jgi:hypothetical protein
MDNFDEQIPVSFGSETAPKALPKDIRTPAETDPKALQNLSKNSMSDEGEIAGGVILGERWPVLRRAMGKYSERVAEEFSQKAYEHVEGGIIRQDGRRELALAAKQMEIREFDAQLLIACAVRKWGMDRRYDASPSPEAPELSAEYKAWGRVWKRIALVIGMAAVVDGVIIWKMFS